MSTCLSYLFTVRDDKLLLNRKEPDKAEMYREITGYPRQLSVTLSYFQFHLAAPVTAVWVGSWIGSWLTRYDCVSVRGSRSVYFGKIQERELDLWAHPRLCHECRLSEPVCGVCDCARLVLVSSEGVLHRNPGAAMGLRTKRKESNQWPAHQTRRVSCMHKSD